MGGVCGPPGVWVRTISINNNNNEYEFIHDWMNLEHIFGTFSGSELCHLIIKEMNVNNK